MKPTDNFEAFSKELSSWTDKLMPEQVVPFQKKITFELHRRFVLRTPVDTGHLRRNWQVTVSTPADGEVSTAAPPSAALANLKPFSVVYITNNVPYLEVLEFGGFIPADPENSPEANKARKARRDKPRRKQARALDTLQRGLKSARGGDAGIPMVRGGFSIQAPQGIFNVVLLEVQGMFP